MQFKALRKNVSKEMRSEFSRQAPVKSSFVYHVGVFQINLKVVEYLKFISLDGLREL